MNDTQGTANSRTIVRRAYEKFELNNRKRFDSLFEVRAGLPRGGTHALRYYPQWDRFELQRAFAQALWKPRQALLKASIHGLRPGTLLFETPMAGRINVLSIATLPAAAAVWFRAVEEDPHHEGAEPKGIGVWQAQVDLEDAYWEPDTLTVPFTCAVVVPTGSGGLLAGFGPGDPLSATAIQRRDLPSAYTQDPVNKRTAMGLGVEFVRVVHSKRATQPIAA